MTDTNATVNVGDKVWIWAQGRHRESMVLAVSAKRKLTCGYRSPTSGRIFVKKVNEADAKIAEPCALTVRYYGPSLDELRAQIRLDQIANLKGRIASPAYRDHRVPETAEQFVARLTAELRKLEATA